MVLFVNTKVMFFIKKTTVASEYLLKSGKGSKMGLKNKYFKAKIE